MLRTDSTDGTQDWKLRPDMADDHTGSWVFLLVWLYGCGWRGERGGEGENVT